MHVTALVVTYNRRELLQECLTALGEQTSPIDHLIVVDNHSVDGTREYLDGLDKNWLIVEHLPQNIGGAGGFYEGIKVFMQTTTDELLWLMDDDTIPQSTALEQLLVASHGLSGFGFLASNVRWVDGQPARMNIPVVDNLRWNQMSGGVKFYPVIQSASFVSLLLRREVIGDKSVCPTRIFSYGGTMWNTPAASVVSISRTSFLRVWSCTRRRKILAWISSLMTAIGSVDTSMLFGIDFFWHMNNVARIN